MSDIIEVIVPFENVNDEYVLIADIEIAQGEHVEKDDVILVVETSKAAVEILADRAGVIDILVEKGQEVKTGGKLCFIGDSLEKIEEYKSQQTETITRNEASDVSEYELPEGTTFSKKALSLVKELNLDPGLFADKKIVKEKDVLVVKNSQTDMMPQLETASDEKASRLDGLDLSDVSITPHLFDEETGCLSPSFLTYLQENRASFARKSSEKKCKLYKENGASIGDNVVIGENSVIVSPQIILGDDVTFSENSDIECYERLVVGKLSRFGGNLSLRCRIASFGEGIYAGENIRIGGGGNRDPWAILSVGNMSFIGDEASLNVCRQVLIGRDVFLTQRSILITHNIGHSILEGFENRFAPIVLEDQSQVGMNSTVYAGARVGCAAIVGSNSYVVSSVQAGKMVMGVPAKFVANSSRHVSRTHQISLTRTIIEEYHTLLLMKGHDVSALSRNKDSFVVQHETGNLRLVFEESFDGKTPERTDDAELVLLTLESPKGLVASNQYAIINLLSKTVYGEEGVLLESTREFLRKKGIRCVPEPWRYTGGLI